MNGVSGQQVEDFTNRHGCVQRQQLQGPGKRFLSSRSRTVLEDPILTDKLHYLLNYVARTTTAEAGLGSKH